MKLRRIPQARLWCPVLLLAFLLCLSGASPSALAGKPQKGYPIETRYGAAGSWAIGTADVTDSSGTVIYNLFYPTNLGAGGFKHPVITWGNGTGALPSQYVGVLGQLASWGFVVVASTSTTTAKGTEMLAGVDYLVGENSNAASIFYQRLDTTQIGALGHSQGAGGTVNATYQSGGSIKTAVPINLPDQRWVGPGDEFYVSQLSVPVLFLGGSSDRLIAPPSTLEGYYAQVPGAAAVAVLKNAGHNTIQDTGGRYLGYLTAWMMYQLQGDAYARGAFVGKRPEINGNRSWQNQAEQNLP